MLLLLSKAPSCPCRGSLNFGTIELRSVILFLFNQRYAGVKLRQCDCSCKLVNKHGLIPEELSLVVLLLKTAFNLQSFQAVRCHLGQIIQQMEAVFGCEECQVVVLQGCGIVSNARVRQQVHHVRQRKGLTELAVHDLLQQQ